MALGKNLYSSQRNFQTLPSRDVFILGAGFSKAIDSRMPVMSELTAALAESLPKHTLTVVPFMTDDFELGLTYLAEGHPGISEPERLRNRALFLEITQQLAKLLVDRTEKVAAEPTCSWLAPFAHYLHDTRATVVTLNYDTLLETAFSNISICDGYQLDTRNVVGLEVDYGNVFHETLTPSARLLKLHGSTSWFYSGSDSYFGEVIYGRPLPGKIPLILPPVAQKNTYFKNERVQGQWASASEAIAKADRVFCIGYSLPLADLTFRFLLQTPRADVAPFYVINSDSGRLDHFTKHLSAGLRVAGDFCGGGDCIERLVAHLERELLLTNGDAHPLSTIFRNQLGAAGIALDPDLQLVGSDRHVAVVACDDQALVVRESGVICRIPWACFEKALERMANEMRGEVVSPCLLREIDSALSGVVFRNVTRTIVTILEKLGRVRYFVEYGAEYVELTERL